MRAAARKYRAEVLYIAPSGTPDEMPELPDPPWVPRLYDVFLRRRGS